MATITINLRLVSSGKKSYELQWDDEGTWTKVSADSPTTTVNSGDEIDWVGDDSIKKMKIKFTKGDIIPNDCVSGNDSDCPKGQCNRDLGPGLSDSYTITVKPADGGPTGEYDPKVKTPGGD